MSHTAKCVRCIRYVSCRECAKEINETTQLVWKAMDNYRYTVHSRITEILGNYLPNTDALYKLIELVTNHAQVSSEELIKLINVWKKQHKGGEQ